MTKVFISYSREDKRYREEFFSHTAVLRRQRLIEVWTDEDIGVGRRWEPVIWENLETSGIIVILATPDFFNSEFAQRELDAALDLQSRGKATVVAVIVRPCHWKGTELRHFQVMCADLPVYSHGREKEDRDNAWLKVVEAIEVLATKATGPKPGDIRINPIDQLEYVWVAPGSFLMGAGDDDAEAGSHDRPQHHVTITKGFWIGRTPVTQAAYERVMKANPSAYEGADRPVECVTWFEADAYAKAVGGRLPTEAEWEYGARAGSTGPRYAALTQIAKFNRSMAEGTYAVAQMRANAFGLHDMIGNVWEWTSDNYGPYAADPLTDPTGPPRGSTKVMRWRILRRHCEVPPGRRSPQRRSS